MDTLNWLLDSDPALRWQVLRDLTDASPAEVAAERARVPREGLAAQILTSQQSNGAWRRPDAPAWATTLFTLLLLRATGIDSADPAVAAAIARCQTNLRWNDNGGRWDLRPPDTGGNQFFEGEVEPCINGGLLAIGAYFNQPNDRLAHRLLEEQLNDGGWNCEAPKSVRSSFHTTICVLEGLREYERAVGTANQLAPQIAISRRRAEEYLLERRLFRRLSTGEIANAQFLELAFPPRYRYDILRALDYFRETNVIPDPRTSDAVEQIVGRKQPDGRWLLDRAYDEVLPFPVAEAAGQPSQWNTLRALRVLRWFGQEKLQVR